ncbi:benzoate/H(+) symporter BenE family transporter [Crenobacter sp. SG2305]|uniref:benzoate/H(+) symporter BenE family transporter n=1 Tax=Crenobacter oryzisoli TaxID=3056844 RepID=UPI0025AA919B|nr:benzoate/H(+) symporter BenE family transporter [Crenobacter sp. SG2305]MDN0082046.1 benzoate/H(+) symporter BenE family transporter [Crenobacter sp. SG2305]
MKSNGSQRKAAFLSLYGNTILTYRKGNWMALKWRSPDEYQQGKTLTISKDWSISAVTAGFLAVLISYAGPAVIFFQAAKAANMPNEMIASWVWGISMGAAVSGIFLAGN